MANFDIDSGFVFILSKEEFMDCYAALLTAADQLWEARMTAELTNEERQEALSIRYVDAARVVRLASGKFVVFSMTRGEIIGTAQEPEINSQLGDAIAEACRRSREFWEASREQERSAGDSAVASIKSSAVDLGL